MTPSLYDLLDLDESASADEIRSAWKSAIADLEPSDRRFRAYNDAAGVLLDTTKRSAYDDGLAADRVDEVEPESEVSLEKVSPRELPEPAQPVVAPPAVDEAPVPAPDAHHDAEPPSVRGGPKTWLVGVAALLALASLVLTVWVSTRPGVDGASSGSQADAGTVGHAAVEQEVADKIVPAMSYDYRTLPADLKKLQAYMTPAMAGKQAAAWKALSAQAKQQHAVVVSHTPDGEPGTGLTRMSDDGTQAVVVAFIDQDVHKLATAAFTLKMWATFVLEKDPTTGNWLVSNICTDSVCA